MGPSATRVRDAVNQPSLLDPGSYGENMNANRYLQAIWKLSPTRHFSVVFIYFEGSEHLN